MDRRHFIAGGATVLVGCAGNLRDAKISDDEYKIYNAIWAGFPCEFDQPTELVESSTFVISRSNEFWEITPTMTHRFLPDQGKTIRIPQEAIENFYAANAKPFPINPTQANISRSCIELITPEQSREIGRALNTDEQSRAYRDSQIKALQNGEPMLERTVVPETIHRVSRFGFNAARNFAIGGRTFYCGRICAANILVVAEKTGDTWHITDELELMVS